MHFDKKNDISTSVLQIIFHNVLTLIKYFDTMLADNQWWLLEHLQKSTISIPENDKHHRREVRNG